MGHPNNSNSATPQLNPNKFEDGITVCVDVVFFQLQHFPVTTTDLYQPRLVFSSYFSFLTTDLVPTKKVKAVVGSLFPKTCGFSPGFSGAQNGDVPLHQFVGSYV